jgi:hypothetical protein
LECPRRVAALAFGLALFAATAGGLITVALLELRPAAAATRPVGWLGLGGDLVGGLVVSQLVMSLPAITAAARLATLRVKPPGREQ